MSDSGEAGKKPAVPSWQLNSQSTAPKDAEPAPESPSRETVIEQARKFLDEDEVRKASTDKKIAFLEGKGLNSEEITELLGVSRNPEATAPSHSEDAAPSQIQQPASNPPTQPSYPSQQARDTPPIITYPEFLTTPPHPTPLVTKSRLLTTLYIFGGLSALLYGTNTYLVEPMLASLTTSRLSLAETTSENLQKLIDKLEGVVSEIPAAKSGKLEVDTVEDEESDEDPTEMFHRDIGVQTSLPATPSLSRPASPAPPATHLDDQTSRLESLNKSISGLTEDSTAEGHVTNALSTTVSVLREYLDGLAYVAPSYGYANAYSGINGSGPKDLDDEIVKITVLGSPCFKTSSLQELGA
ncbi:hypothetical protein D0Z07_8115 [Hyphodiscus hymeniophilus]|uniref:Peroxisomal membrane protein PEX14 n=1 Tax=Hyphodiscus hymeniophilus TaxID=353542 RepID=A0A9P6VEG8_9HELO|nr:hypothetical protein D0Z07_8115 [Hyphodiscus hymeniophilus]